MKLTTLALVTVFALPTNFCASCGTTTTPGSTSPGEVPTEVPTETDGPRDDDGDGYTDDVDCNDADASSYPGGVELCDGRDNDCDGTTDGFSVCADSFEIAFEVDCFDLETSEVLVDTFGWQCEAGEDGDFEWADADTGAGPQAILFWNEVEANVAFFSADCDDVDTAAIDAATFCEHYNETTPGCGVDFPGVGLGCAVVETGDGNLFKVAYDGETAEEVSFLVEAL